MSSRDSLHTTLFPSGTTLLALVDGIIKTETEMRRSFHESLTLDENTSKPPVFVVMWLKNEPVISESAVPEPRTVSSSRARASLPPTITPVANTQQNIPWFMRPGLT